MLSREPYLPRARLGEFHRPRPETRLVRTSDGDHDGVTLGGNGLNPPRELIGGVWVSPRAGRVGCINPNLYDNTLSNYRRRGPQ